MRSTPLSVCIALLFGFLAVAGHVFAEEGRPPAPPPEKPAPELTLSKAMPKVEALQKKMTLDLEGATIANMMQWLREAGVNVIMPTALLPRADDANAQTFIVKVKDMPLAMVVEQFLTAAELNHTVKVTDVDGQAMALVAIVPSANSGMRNFFGMMPGNNMMQRRPMGAQLPRQRPQDGGRQQGGRNRGANNAPNPNQPADEPGEAF